MVIMPFFIFIERYNIVLMSLEDVENKKEKVLYLSNVSFVIIHDVNNVNKDLLIKFYNIYMCN